MTDSPKPPANGKRWACIGIADNGSEMLMGWECETRQEAEEIRDDCLFYRDLPADRLKVVHRG